MPKFEHKFVRYQGSVRKPRPVSIVELSQAQLQQTQATISNAQAGYDYRLALSVLRYQTIGL